MDEDDDENEGGGGARRRKKDDKVPFSPEVSVKGPGREISIRELTAQNYYNLD